MRFTSWLVVTVMVALASTAHADQRDQARKVYDDATMHYNLAEYDRALDEFKASYRLVREPALLFNIGQCQRQLGDYDGAQKSYRAFLREAGEIPEGQRAEVQRLIETMDQAIKDKRAQQPPTGTQPPIGTATSAAPASAPAPLVVDTPAPLKLEPRPVYKRAWFWGVVGGAVVVVAVGVGLGVGLQSSTTYPSAPPGAIVVRY